MLVQNYKKYLNLSKILNTNFGSAGYETDKPYHKNTQAIKFEILDDGMLKCRVIMIVNFGSDTMMREMRKKYEQECVSLLDAALKNVKEKYKTMFPNDEQPTFEMLDSTRGDDVEFLSYSIFNGSRKAYYKFGVLVKVS